MASGDLDELIEYQSRIADVYLARGITTQQFHDIHANICTYLASRA